MGTGYHDCDGREYHVNDLVLNELFGDVWLVDEWRPEDAPGPEDSPYCLVLNCDRSEYVIDIEDPDGFRIIARKGDDGYQEIYDECVAVAKARRELYPT